jgi:hypothetical protein
MSPHHETRRLGRITMAALLTAGLSPALAGEESSTRTRFGFDAGGVSTSQNYHTFVGINAGRHTSTTAEWNTFVGTNAGYNNLNGFQNDFFGVNAGYANTTGHANAFFGTTAGRYNSTGYSNTFLGNQSGSRNTTGALNTYTGEQSGFSNETGSYNTIAGARAGTFVRASKNSFFGHLAGYGGSASGSTGESNVFVGYRAGSRVTTGSFNAFSGADAGRINTSGSYNTFSGMESGRVNTTGGYNSFLGRASGYNSTTGNLNTFVGYGAGFTNTTAHRNSTLGGYADVAADITNATAIGFQAKVSQSNSLVLGAIPGLNTPQGANSYVAVGMGTDQPAAPLHVKRDVTGTSELALLENSSGTPANRVMLEMVNRGGSAINFANVATGQTWVLRAAGGGSGVFDIYRVGGAALVRVNSAGNMTLLGTLTQNSNVHDKTGIEAVDAQAVLGKVQALPIRRWRYKADEGSAHVGPMAQDFHAAFGLGTDATKIAPGDMAGVALAAIQALQKQMAAQEQQLARQQRQLAEQRERVVALDRQLAAQNIERARHHEAIRMLTTEKDRLRAELLERVDAARTTRRAAQTR